jgi:hypothetical protein
LVTDDWRRDTSSGWITEGLGTFVSRLANKWSLNESFKRIAFRDETSVGASSSDLSRDIFKDTFSSNGVARVFGTCIVVVTVLWNMYAQSSISVTAVCSTCVVVVTVNGLIYTFSGVSITRVGGTFVVIVTDNLRVNTFSGDCITASGVTCIRSFAVLLGEDASGLSITSINGTCIVIVTGDWGLDHGSGCGIARISVTFVIFFHLNNVVFWSVDASSDFVAGINSTCISISARHWGVYTVSRSEVTAIFGTCVAVITSFTFVSASSSLWVTAVFGTWIVVVTVNVSGISSVLLVTQVEDTFVWINFNWDCVVCTASVCTDIVGTCVVIVTDNWSVDASLNIIARVDSASVVVIARFWSMDTSFNLITGINGTFVLVVTASFNVRAFSGGGIARVISTCIVVVTNNRSVEESFSLSTSDDHAFVWIICVSLDQVNRSRQASEEWIASFNGTFVLVITWDRFVFNFSGLCITPISGTCVLVINLLRSVDTSGSWVT